MINIQLKEIYSEEFQGDFYDKNKWDTYSYSWDASLGCYYYVLEDVDFIVCHFPVDGLPPKGNVGQFNEAPPVAMTQVGDIVTDIRPLGVEESTLLKALAVVQDPKLAFNQEGE